MQKYGLTFFLVIFGLLPAWAKSTIHPATLFVGLAVLSTGFIVALWVAIWLRRKRK